jgi:uncharacterized protein YbjT (DUF2867 family)
VRFVVTGAAGHVSKSLTQLLRVRGHGVTVIGRKAENLAGLVKLGAKAALGDLEDVPFLTRAFCGADGVYLMVPPSFHASDLKKHSTALAEGYARAIRGSGVQNVIFLSSYGAHRLDDAGAISGLGRAERVLNKIRAVNVLHLRAGYFYTNLLWLIDVIRNSGVMGSMFEIPPGAFTLVDTDDIALAAAEALTRQDFIGKTYRYVVSDESGTDEIASVLGKAIGRPELKWVKFPAADVKNVLLSFGFAEGAANDYIDMVATLNTGLLFEDYVRVRPRLYPTKLEDFARRFASAYRAWDFCYGNPAFSHPSAVEGVQNAIDRSTNDTNARALVLARRPVG